MRYFLLSHKKYYVTLLPFMRDEINDFAIIAPLCCRVSINDYLAAAVAFYTTFRPAAVLPARARLIELHNR
jgi:hypothetical protein